MFTMHLRPTPVGKVKSKMAKFEGILWRQFQSTLRVRLTNTFDHARKGTETERKNAFKIRHDWLHF